MQEVHPFVIADKLVAVIANGVSIVCCNSTDPVLEDGQPTTEFHGCRI
jgi:hypothetical protein